MERGFPPEDAATATEKERENKRGKPGRQKKTAPSFYRKKNDGAVRK